MTNRAYVRMLLLLIAYLGMDEYSSFTRQASVGAHGYIFVYSISSMSSLVKLKQVRENLLNLIGNDAVPIILVAQKCDLTEYREVSSAEGRDLANRWNCPYLEVSAKMNRNVGTLLESGWFCLFLFSSLS